LRVYVSNDDGADRAIRALPSEAAAGVAESAQMTSRNAEAFRRATVESDIGAASAMDTASSERATTTIAEKKSPEQGPDRRFSPHAADSAACGARRS
jgi:hypothetical protein